MKCSLIVVAAALVGCATVTPSPQALARHHADNLAAADKEGYKVVSRDGRTFFCPTAPAIGSHVVAGCLSEPQWQERELWVWSGSGRVLGTGESGRSWNEGSASAGR